MARILIQKVIGQRYRTSSDVKRFKKWRIYLSHRNCDRASDGSRVSLHLLYVLRRNLDLTVVVKPILSAL